jgi:DNA-damage-inducible protein J
MKAQTSIRVEKEIYESAKEILKELGLSYSQAINVFNAMIVKYKGLPFEVKLPDEETIKAIEEYKQGKGKRFDSVDELFKDLDE